MRKFIPFEGDCYRITFSRTCAFRCGLVFVFKYPKKYWIFNGSRHAMVFFPVVAFLSKILRFGKIARMRLYNLIWKIRRENVSVALTVMEISDFFPILAEYWDDLLFHQFYDLRRIDLNIIISSKYTNLMDPKVAGGKPKTNFLILSIR